MSKLIKEKFICYRDGFRIAGTVLRPRRNNLPIAVLSHGFLANSKMMSKYMRVLAENGYAAFCFDFVGGCIIGKSGGKLIDMSIQTETDDLKTVIAFAKTQSYVTPEKICLMGCSQGGVVSALCAAQLKDEVEKLILFYPAFCIPDDARNGKMMMFEFDPSNVPDILKCKIPFLKLSRIYPESVLNMDIWSEIKKYTGNVLIVHGTNDKIVNTCYAKRAKEEYDDAGANCRLVLIDGGGHMFARKYDKPAIEQLKQFCSQLVIRKYESADLKTVSELFYDTVHTVNAKDYSPEQLYAWAKDRDSLIKRQNDFQEQTSFIAQIGEKTVGFASIDKSGCLDMLYVHKDFQRQKIAAALCDEAEKPFAAITTFSSITAKPFFEKRGYTVIREQEVERFGIKLKNYKMRKIKKNSENSQTEKY